MSDPIDIYKATDCVDHLGRPADPLNFSDSEGNTPGRGVPRCHCGAPVGQCGHGTALDKDVRLKPGLLEIPERWKA